MSNVQQNTFRSPYTIDKIIFNNNEAQGVSNMIRKFVSKHMIPIKPDYYLVNCITGECTCLDFIWYGSLHSFCKHGHAALASNAKNHIIYTGSDEEAYTEILWQYKINGSEVFFLTEIQTTEKDPFRPNELPRQKHTTVGPSRINGIKLCESKEDSYQIIIEDDIGTN
ncbi:proteophosphoglycan ppg4 [Gigaspora margarita]|uniref:Proteophosphoglycan ppg4 n=1 Tax=Gigaspora margarita TaxID=4874 RepID=A0A8H3XHT9_GIGMA|nr:proteophosphoglycan ppg4 [Gigaspora margarita]